VLLGRQGWKVWRSSDGVRIAHLLDLREQDLVASRHAAWFWDSATMTATRLVPASAPGGASMSADPALDPAALARAVIEGLGPCASLSVQGTATVAGRDTYVLALTPTTSDSRIGSVQIDIDAATRVPLRVAVVPVGTEDPAIEAGYTSVSFAPVDPSMFDFTPPPGATVRDAADLAPGPRTAAAGDGLPTITEVRALGSCAGTALAVRLDGPLPPDAAGLLPYEGPLASVVEVDRGDHVWLLAGLVDAGTLEDRAATLP
jgi:outer membrane lipoprotein-sorting protein